MSPREWHERAIGAERGGAPHEAERIITEALGAFPREHPLHNTAGNIALRRGDFMLAAKRFGQALAIEPSHLPYAINQAIALSEGGDPDAALETLARHERTGTGDARYCSTRANAARLAGDLGQSALWYDRALSKDATARLALAGRARVALQRCENDTLARIDLALSHNPGDAHLWLAKGQALDLLGDREGALTVTRQIVDQAPAWRPALDQLAQLRNAAGERDFASHYRDAAHKMPQDPIIPAAHIAALTAVERFDQAAQIARDAQARFAQDELFVLLEAANASASGDDDSAEKAFARLHADTIDRALHEARHAIRTQDWAGAQAALDRAMGHAPFSVSAWALLGLLWRVTEDPRAQWLHGQENLVRAMPLVDGDSVLPPAIALLRQIHATAALPHDQSLRGGTQTRGILFDRTEPELAALREAIEATVERYRSELPPVDPAHPLLRQANGPWALAGSWSVRLTSGGDHHAAHIHPLGVLSSALYLLLPQVAEGSGEAALELGRPPPDLRLDLPPVHVIEPAAGHLALFPSTLYHGTTAFSAGERMTVAFDVVARKAAGRGFGND